MKKLLFVLLLALLPACELIEDEIEIGNIYDYDFPGSEGIPKFETIEDAQCYMQDNFEYEYDIDQFGQADYWQTPEEFYYNGKGDCEDYVIFLGYVLHFIMGYEDVNLIVTDDHVILYCDNKYLSGQCRMSYKPEDIEIVYEIHYSEALWMTVNYHDNIGKYR
jgi:hypothetical protein